MDGTRGSRGLDSGQFQQAYGVHKRWLVCLIEMLGYNKLFTPSIPNLAKGTTANMYRHFTESEKMESPWLDATIDHIQSTLYGVEISTTTTARTIYLFIYYWPLLWTLGPAAWMTTGAVLFAVFKPRSR